MKGIKTIILILYILLLIKPSNIYAIEKDKLLVIDDISTWKYQNNKWYNIDSIDEKTKFKVYIDNNYKGLYNLKGTDIYDNNKKVSYDGRILAYTENLNIKVNSYNIINIPEEILDEINSIMNISLKEEDLSINEYVKIDLDNNGILDEIINVSNLDSLEIQSKYFYLTYLKLNNQKQVLLNDEVNEQDILNAPVYNLTSIINIDNSNFSSILLEEGYFSEAGTPKHILYSNESGTYNKVEIEEEKIKKSSNNKTIENYTLYIFSLVLIVIILIGTKIFNKMKEKNNGID